MGAPETSSTFSQAALPDSWIERIFQRMVGRFGNTFLDKFRTGQLTAGGEDSGLVNAKIVWAEDLAGLTGEQIKRGLQASYQFPPSCDEFREKCKAAPPQTHCEPFFRALPKPKADPDEVKRRMAEAMAKAGGMGTLQKLPLYLDRIAKNLDDPNAPHGVKEISKLCLRGRPEYAHLFDEHEDEAA